MHLMYTLTNYGSLEEVLKERAHQQRISDVQDVALVEAEQWRGRDKFLRYQSQRIRHFAHILRMG